MIWSRAGILIPRIFFGNSVFLYESNTHARRRVDIPYTLRMPPSIERDFTLTRKGAN
jgi:hypothetical protein